MLLKVEEMLAGLSVVSASGKPLHMLLNDPKQLFGTVIPT